MSARSPSTCDKRCPFTFQVMFLPEWLDAFSTRAPRPHIVVSVFKHYITLHHAALHQATLLYNATPHNTLYHFVSKHPQSHAATRVRVRTRHEYDRAYARWHHMGSLWASSRSPVCPRQSSRPNPPTDGFLHYASQSRNPCQSTAWVESCVAHGNPASDSARRAVLSHYLPCIAAFMQTTSRRRRLKSR